MNNAKTIDKFIDNLTAKFALAQKQASFIGAEPPVPIDKVVGWERQTPQGEWKDVNQAPRSGFAGFNYSTPVLDAPATWPGMIPTPDWGNYLTRSGFGFGQKDPASDYEMYAAVPGSSDYPAAIINSLVGAGAGGALGMAARRLPGSFNYNLAQLRKGQLGPAGIPPFGTTTRDLTIPQLEGLLQDEAPGPVKEVHLEGGMTGDKVLNDKARLAEYINLHTKHGLTPQEFAAFKKLQASDPNLNFDSYLEITRYLSDPKLQAEFASLKARYPQVTPGMYSQFKTRQNRKDDYTFETYLREKVYNPAQEKAYIDTSSILQKAPPPRPDPLPLTRVQIDTKGSPSLVTKALGKDPSTRSAHIDMHRHPHAKGLLPYTFSILGGLAPWFSNYGNYNQFAPELIPISTQLPGGDKVTPIHPKSVSEFENAATEAGAKVRREQFDPNMFKDF